MPNQATAPAPADHRAGRRQAIVEAAARLFAELGYTDCEMERVASELKIAKGTLYLYFSSKEELFYACVDDGMRQMQKAVNDAADQTQEPFEQISQAIRTYFQFFEDHPEHVELLIQERANFKHRKRPTYFEYRESNLGRWRDLWAGLIRQGRIRDDLPVDRILDIIGNLLYGTMFTNHFVGRTVSSQEQFESILEIVLSGLLTDAERRKRQENRSKNPEQRR